MATLYSYGKKISNNGLTPYIGENGNWWIGNNDTGVRASNLVKSVNGKTGDVLLTATDIPIQNGEETTTVASAVSELKEDLSEVEKSIRNVVGYEEKLNLEIINGSYVTVDGKITDYRTWARTDFVYCGDADYIIPYTTGSESNKYNAFYAEADETTFISNFLTKDNTETMVKVPSGAKYFIISNSKKCLVTNGTFYVKTKGTDAISVMQDTIEELKGKTNSDSADSDVTPLRNGIIPSYYTEKPTSYTSFADNEYLEGKVETIPHGNSFFFVTDVHWENNAKQSNKLIEYLRKRTGIAKVLFGGDVINQNKSKYEAVGLLKDYTIDARTKFGKDFLFVQGNHDLNTASAGSYTAEELAEALIPYTEIEKVTVKEIAPVIVQETDAEIAERLSAYSIPSADYEQIKAYFKLHYYCDDEANKTRYIVLTTGNARNGVINDYFGINGTVELLLQLDWLYDVLMSVPSGYNIVLCGHVMINYSSDLMMIRPLNVAEMLSALKTKSVVKINGSDKTKMQGIFASGEHSFDFSNANDVGKVVIMCGDAHWDVANLAKYVDSTFTAVPYSANEVTADSVLCILTQTDAYNSSNYPKCAKMTLGTVTEQCFDVVTLKDNTVVCTRIGAGDDRVFSY